MRIIRVISGGQTGADIAGLRAASRCGIRTGGAAPVGWMTEDGSNEQELRSFGLLEHGKPGYRARTMQNIRDSDVTIVIANHITGGSKTTIEKCDLSGKPVFQVHPVNFGDEASFREVVKWLQSKNPRVINIAGNRESKSPGLERRAEEFLVKLFREINT